MHSVRWRRIDIEGTDRATLVEAESGYLLLGHARLNDAQGFYDLHYSVDLDSVWHTQQARVDGLGPSGPISFHIEVKPPGAWHINGKLLPAVKGCIDLDLSFTPATNLISIRRLALGSGASANVIAAWLDFPNPELQPLRQIYQRQPDGRYGYRCPDLPFESVLEVDPAGFVTSYPPLWVPEYDRQ